MKSLKLLLIILCLSATISITAQEKINDITWIEEITRLKENSKHFLSTIEKENSYQEVAIKNDTLIFMQTKLGKPYKKITIPLQQPYKVYGHQKEVTLVFQNRLVITSIYNTKTNTYGRKYGNGRITLLLNNNKAQTNILKAFKRLKYLIRKKK